MTKGCIVPQCKTGYKSLKKKYSVFKVPSDVEMCKKWLAAIPGIVQGLKPSQHVCEKHFEERFILRKWIKHDSNGQIIAEVPYKHPRLNAFAIPTIFNDVMDCSTNVPSSIECSSSASSAFVETLGSSSHPINSEHSLLADDLIQIPMDRLPGSEQHIVEASYIQNVENYDPKECIVPQCKTASSIECSSSAFVETLGFSSHLIDSKHSLLADNLIQIPMDHLPSSEQHIVESSYVQTNVRTSSAISEKSLITIPKYWSCAEVVTDEGPAIIFSFSVIKKENNIKTPLTIKNVVLSSDKRLSFFVYGRVVAAKNHDLCEILNDISLLPKCLESFKNMNVCNGLGVNNGLGVYNLPVGNTIQNFVNQWRHKDCTLISTKKRCEFCVRMRKQMQKKEARLKSNKTLTRIRGVSNETDKRKLIAIRKKIIHEKREKNRARLRVQLLKQSLKDKANEIASIHDKTLDQRCTEMNILALQKTALKEIISAARNSNATNRRYSEEWIMLCLLMNIRSPRYYEFLRKNNILPLPCKRTICSYFSLTDMKCGFDEELSKMLKKHFDIKSSLQRHGVLLMDEINLRKSVTVCSKNLTYIGLTDFGNNGPQATNIEDQATHGLVLMFQSLADSYTQTIAVFASKNPVKGDELAKIVIKAIIYMELCGAKIHGVITDGAMTNVKMMSVLGVSGLLNNTKTWFMHPVDDERKVFFFSDTPHLIKNIRNRLYNKKTLRVKSSDNYICWNYFKILYDFDVQHAGNARVCPKLTERHVVLDNPSKMRVRLATQIFSNSVAQGLSFYLSLIEGPFKGSEETIQFCKKINDMFDALNRKAPNQGVTPQSNDFKILRDSLDWLNQWETAVQEGDISADEYLTSETSKGLRLTLQSSMDLCRYLIEKFDFEYLLTGKVNQDNLEYM